MADIGKGIKDLWLKGMEAIGNTASNIANSTRYKVDENNLVNRREQILSEFGNRAYAMWQKGEHFPAELEAELAELTRVDEQLNDLRAERLAGVKTAETTGTNTAEEVEREAEATEEPAVPEESAETEESSEPCESTENDVPVIVVEKEETEEAEEKKEVSEPLSSAINDLFNK